ncbi:PD-(D/E)XK nuclease superfamily protein [Methyloligella halotolerans]|uniref:PD-(D/E)XK nuclease superfamily protein n=1 Tax=Methyloligella halotolerans TaxID=1177755 RepID=A0A1E2S0B4_9HYPH|nr:double-strand break repair protein AddB [Methyloligella halotolerans]ODA67778.1 PD-(D/E)XK nuclease superfamily protein [Methyloligella halotolerans]
MAEPARQRPRLYSIPPSAPFLETLARAILSGDLPHPGGAAPDPFDLPSTTIYLPTRRAARGLREAFLAAAGGKTLLLPQIRALGDPEEETLLFSAELDDGEGVAGKPAISNLQRRFALMQLIFAWERSLPKEPDRPPGITPAQASHLADDLGRFMDEVGREEADLSDLEALVPEDLAGHWAQTIDFLTIVTEHWPNFLDENGLVSPAERRRILMDQEAARLEAIGDAPVIAAGSTGTVPATARLLQTISTLPNGAVVLPGLDFSLDDESWEALGRHPEHPQAGMWELLRRLELERSEVATVPGADADDVQSARLRLVSEVLRPAETTERWQALAGDGGIADALQGISLIEAPGPQDEAEAIALILRHAVEEPDRKAALITPDRALARRVAARVRQFGLAIDDSAGTPVTRTVPGAFLSLVLEAAHADFAPAELMALLKHPLTRLGRSAGAMRMVARLLERAAFRDVYLGQGFAGIRAAATTEPERPHAARRLKGEEIERVLALVDELEAAFSPLATLGKAASASAYAEAHAAAAEALAMDETGSSDRLWMGDAGEALSVFLRDLMAEGGGTSLRAADYPAFYRSLLSGQVVRPARGAHPRLFIWGPLEARLQQTDVVILGGLNEGTWPKPQEPGPWLNRAMREALGLPAPERRVGLSAHDFAQSLGANRIYLTRSLKVDGVPTVPSRWVQRLTALTRAISAGDGLRPTDPWTAWAKMRDHVDGFAPVAQPAPRPPVDARPRRLSVSRIERWIANPYDVYARDILRLEPLPPLGQTADAALRGKVVHAALSIFAERYPDRLPENISGTLTGIADELFAGLGGAARIEAFWRPHFENFARWFAETEPLRREGAIEIVSEVRGALRLDALDFELTARADRIDILDDGTLAIYDYKTGSPPAPSAVDGMHAPQLPLEAAIARLAGFGEIGPRPVSALRYIQASGRRDGGEEREAGQQTPDALADEAMAALAGLVKEFDDAARAYEAMRRSGTYFGGAYRYDDFAQLARVDEWGNAGGEGE